MKTLFLPAESEIDIIPVLEKALKLLPEKVGIVTTAQHLSKLREARKFLEKNKKKVVIGGQVLGCNVANAEKIAGRADCILFIGSGKFHPMGILTRVKRMIIANPFTNEVNEIGEAEIRKIEALRKSAMSKFLFADRIGVAISAKKGQNAKVDRKKLQKKYPGKKFYYFACDTMIIDELENFPFVQAWINTMCPRIAYEDLLRTRIPIVNIEDV